VLVDEYDTFINDYLEPNSHLTLNGTPAGSNFKSFWNTLKTLWQGGDIPRIFVTGISSLSLTDVASGFNVSQNLSFDENLAGLCGLTRMEIEAALRSICSSDDDVNYHLSYMTEYANGYHFCRSKTVDSVYNTETCLEYLQSVVWGRKPSLEDPQNSEVSEQFLNRFASSSCAIADFERALVRDKEGFKPLEYDQLKENFKLTELSRDIEKSRPAWRSLMLYYGGLSFSPEDPGHYLRIPNLIAAKRIAHTVLEKYGLRESLTSTLENLASNGNIQPVLSCYHNLMIQRDVGYSDFEASEKIHRDSFYFSLLRNASLVPKVEFPLTIVRQHSILQWL
jgi:hypothetical protein